MLYYTLSILFTWLVNRTTRRCFWSHMISVFVSPGAYNNKQTQVRVFYPWCCSSAHRITAANTHLRRRRSRGRPQRPRPLLTPPSRRSWPICWRTATRPSACRRPMRSALLGEAPPTCRTSHTHPSSCSPTIWRSRRRTRLRRAAGRRFSRAYPMMHLLTRVSDPTEALPADSLLTDSLGPWCSVCSVNASRYGCDVDVSALGDRRLTSQRFQGSRDFINTRSVCVSSLAGRFLL